MRFTRSLRLIAAMLPLYGGEVTAQVLTPPKITTVSPTGVSLLDANYTYSHTDLKIGSLSLERSYVSGSETTSSYFGSNWTHNFDIRAVTTGTLTDPKVLIVIGRTKYVFLGQPSSSLVPDFDAQGTTLQYTDHFTFIDRHGTTYQFAPGVNGKIASITYANGYAVTVTNVSGKPKLIADNRGYALVLDYGATGITAACGFNLTASYVTAATTCAGAALRTSYGYSTFSGAFTLLSSFVDARNFTTTFGYDANVSLNCVRLPDSSTCQVSNSYDPGHAGRVVSQTMGDGAIWQFGCTCTYDGKDETQDPTNVENSTGITDPRGGSILYGFVGLGPDAIIDQNNQRTDLNYTSAHLNYVKLPEGNQVDFLANTRLEDAGHQFRPKPGSSANPIIPDGMTFPTDAECSSNLITCNLPKTVSDGNGNATTFTYDPVHGGVLTETKPAGSGGVSQVIRHHYAQRYAWIKNSGGGYSPTATPIWVLTDDHTCTSGATSGETCMAGAAKEVVTTYEYGPDSGPNNLLLRGKVVTADGKSLRTCFLYDFQGNKIAETSPRAGLATCS